MLSPLWLKARQVCGSWKVHQVRLVHLPSRWEPRFTSLMSTCHLLTSYLTTHLREGMRSPEPWKHTIPPHPAPAPLSILKGPRQASGHSQLLAAQGCFLGPQYLGLLESCPSVLVLKCEVLGFLSKEHSEQPQSGPTHSCFCWVLFRMLNQGIQSPVFKFISFHSFVYSAKVHEGINKKTIQWKYGSRVMNRQLVEKKM